MDIDLAFSDYSMNLEPRLQEYMRRKNFNRQNNINPNVNIEKEFSITKNDLKTISNYKRGISNKTNRDFVKPSTVMMDNFIEPDFKSDPRYKRVQEKSLSHKKARESMNDLEGLDKEYTIFHETNPYDVKKEKQRITKPYHSNDFNNSLMIDSHDEIMARNDSKYSYNPNTYHHEPKIAYNQIITPQVSNGGLKHSRNINEIIGNIDNYKKHLNNTYNYINDDGNKKELLTDYQNIPFKYGNGIADVALEDSMRGNIKDSKKKSIGFSNPFSHFFSYISGDISDPNHTVQNHPISSRGANKEIARTKY